jgi:hypothetical protein
LQANRYSGVASLVQSFDTIAQQRLKRIGHDLPALRLIVFDAWTSAASRDEFDALPNAPPLSFTVV